MTSENYMELIVRIFVRSDNRRPRAARSQQGMMMVEVLVTVLIVTLGLLGIAGLFARSQQVTDEAAQRIQALHIAGQLADAIFANQSEALKGASSSYVASAVNSGYSPSNADMGHFKSALLGDGVYDAAVTTNKKVALLGAIGCVRYEPPPNEAAGKNPNFFNGDFFTVSVAWQGRQTAGVGGSEPANKGCFDAIVMDSLWRVVSLNVQVQP